jgi:hypothetical protein
VCVFPVQGPGFDFADPRLPRWMAKAHFYALDTQRETSAQMVCFMQLHNLYPVAEWELAVN